MAERKVRTDVDGLAKLINLPDQVEGVRWEHRKTKGGSSLVAVITLGHSALESLLGQAQRLDLQSPVKINSTTSALLFPGGLGKQASGSELELHGTNVDPGPFINPKKSGLVNGIASIVVENQFVYVSLYEM